MTLVAPATGERTRSFIDLDAGDARAPALITADETITYGELDSRIEARRHELGTTRRLVLVTASNTVDAVISYLASLRGGHAVLLAPATDAIATAALIEAYDPNVVLDGARVEERPTSADHDLHQDLALLLSTSGSTGTPKLVRLSRANLEANAAAIAEYLALTPADRAITSLPMHYCYGLSVLNSHLAAGAAVVLTDLSVVDRCFWDLFRRTEATSLAGVPHTFDLLDRLGFPEQDLPSLRYVTQAGGRLRPDVVRRYAGLGANKGWELFVMYGQTEATARIAYVPPSLAASHPECIGVAIPGGTLRIDSPGPDGVGELVYRGDNVMLGYAERPSDLALGRRVHELRTGDLARCNDGLYEVVGRRSRFIKPFGVRIDLDDLERHLAVAGFVTACAGTDDGLVVAVTRDSTAVAAEIDALLGLPQSHCVVVTLNELPRLANGKPDYGALKDLVPHGPPDTGRVTQLDVRAVLASVLGLPNSEIADEETFVSLGGDSLSYVETSVRLEAALGELPRDWHLQPVGQLTNKPATIRKRWARIDTSVVLRTIAIVLIVGSHADVFEIAGGAHALLAVAGFNFGRFQINGGDRWTSIARVAIPSICFIGLVALFADTFGWQHAVFLNGYLGGRDTLWFFWFVEALVQILVVIALVLTIPALRRAERRAPFGFALGALGLGLLVRFDLVTVASWHHANFRPHEIFWLFALGWAAAQANRWQWRAVVTASTLVAVGGYFGDAVRELVVVATVLLVAWVPRVAIPRALLRPVTAVAAASLAIYLTHMPLHLPLERAYGPWPAFVGSMIVGLLAWPIFDRVSDLAGRLPRRSS